jgi:hypothetical protein
MSSMAEDGGRPSAPDARQWASAAVGALNRRDLRFAVISAQHVLRDQDSTVVAVELLSGILLAGLPQGGLRRGTRITLDVITPPGDIQGLRAVCLAADLITAIASGDDELAAPVLHALRGPHGLDIIIVLVRAAAARVEGFVGVDGDTVDAYYAAARDRAHQDQHGW